jgi:two-component system, cell cycle response regulator
MRKEISHNDHVKPSLLIIDDSEAIRGQIRGALRVVGAISQIFEATNGMEGFKVLLNNKVDIVLCDLAMPGIDGFQFLTKLREREDFADIPVIVLGDEAEPEARIKALAMGASDYLIKPFHDEELAARVKVHLSNKLLRNELKEKSERLEENSTIDELTKVANRRRLIDVIEMEFYRAERYQSSLSFIMCGLDNYREIVQSKGALVGDQALIAIANPIRDGLRVNDVFGRYEGSKFGIVLPETNLYGATMVAKRYRLRFEHIMLKNEKEQIQLTASFGVACYPHKDVVQCQDLIKKADKALSLAKSGGGNRVVVLE